MSAAADAAPTGLAEDPLPLFGSIRPYERSWLSKDVIAGITLAALAIPEVMGYTKIAGTPVITGLYTILIPVARLRALRLVPAPRRRRRFGDRRDHVRRDRRARDRRPPARHAEWLAFASLSALITGGFLFLARLARLGFLADFISRTVLVGFLTGVGIQVAMGQFGGHARRALAGRALDQLSGTVIKFWDTLKDIGRDVRRDARRLGRA